MSKTESGPASATADGAGFMADSVERLVVSATGELLVPLASSDEAIEPATVLQRALEPAGQRGLDDWRPMLDAMSHPALLADDEGDVRCANTRMLTLLDEAEDTLCGRGWLDRLHADDSAMAAAQWRASVASGLSFQVRVRLRYGDGGHRWHTAAGKRFTLPDRRTAWLTTFTDIDEHVHAEEARQASQRRFEATLVHAPVGVAYTATNGRFTYANAAFCRLLGYTADELRQRTWQSITHPDDLEADLVLGKAVLEGRQPFYLMDKRYIRKDGHPLYIRLFGNFIRNDSGEVVEGLAVILDLTDLRRAELRQAEATRRRDDFLSMLAHELRNPLVPIRNGAALLKRHPGDEQVAARVGGIIERQTGHLAALLNSLLDVARITRGKIRLERRDCDLVDIVGQVVQDHVDEAAARGLELRAVPRHARMALNADPVRIAQAITNLVSNALHFTSEGRITVTCECEAGGATAVCRVADTGRGMDERTQAHLFEPFSQAEQGIDRALGGLGVGLMIVKAIADLHGGQVSGTSAGPGQGSTFELRLPLAEADRTA